MKQADLSDSYMLVTAPASQCTYAQAAANVMAQTSAAGVVMVYGKGDDVESMGGETTTNSAGQSAAVTAVSYVDGSALISLFEKNEGSLASLTIEMSSEMVPGYFMGIDSERKLYQLGYWWTYSLQYVTLEARYLTYLSTVYEREAKSGYVVPVLDNVPLKNDHPASAHIIDLPSEKIMRDFQTLELDMKLTCVGNLDQECDKWDHVITLGASCNITDDSSTFTYDFYTGGTEGRRLSEDGGFKNEIGRWVTPFRREVGHWLTDVTPLMPMLYKNENGCNFTMEIISGEILRAGSGVRIKVGVRLGVRLGLGRVLRGTSSTTCAPDPPIRSAHAPFCGTTTSQAPGLLRSSSVGPTRFPTTAFSPRPASRRCSSRTATTTIRSIRMFSTTRTGPRTSRRRRTRRARSFSRP